MRAKKLIVVSALILGAISAARATTFAQRYYEPDGYGLSAIWPFADTTWYGYDSTPSNRFEIAQFDIAQFDIAKFDIAQYGHGLYDYAPGYKNLPPRGGEGRSPGLFHVRLSVSGTRKNQELPPDGPAAGVLWGPPLEMAAFLTLLGIGPEGNVTSGMGEWPSLYSPPSSKS